MSKNIAVDSSIDPADPADIAIGAVNVLRGQRDQAQAQVDSLSAQVADLQQIIDDHVCPPPTGPREIRLYTQNSDGWKDDEINPRPGLVAAREAVGMEHLVMTGGWNIDRDHDKVFTAADEPRMDELLLDYARLPEGAMLCLDWENFGKMPGYSDGLHSWWSQPGNQFPQITETAGWQAAMEQHHLLVAYVRSKRPDLAIGHYGIPWRNYWLAKWSVTGYDNEAVQEWRDANDALAPLFAECDVMFPSAYDFYASDDDPWVYKAMTEEWLRVAKQHNQDVHVCVWHRHHGGGSGSLTLTPCTDEEMRAHYKAILEADFNGKQVTSLYCWSGEGYYLSRCRMTLADGSWKFKGGNWDKYRGRYAIEIGENWLNEPTPGEWMEQVYAPWYTLMGEVRDEVLGAVDTPGGPVPSSG